MAGQRSLMPLVMCLSLCLVATGCGSDRHGQLAKMVSTADSMPRSPNEAQRFFTMQRFSADDERYPFEHLQGVDTDLRIREARVEKSRALSGVRPFPSASWTALGPGNTGGRTRALVIDPANPDVMLMGGVV